MVLARLGQSLSKGCHKVRQGFRLSQGFGSGYRQGSRKGFGKGFCKNFYKSSPVS